MFVVQPELTMDKKQKENIKRIVRGGLNVMLTKLKISKPSVKMEQALNKYAKKLADHFKAEVKRLAKKGNKKTTKGKRSKMSMAKGAGSTKRPANTR